MPRAFIRACRNEPCCPVTGPPGVPSRQGISCSRFRSIQPPRRSTMTATQNMNTSGTVNNPRLVTGLFNDRDSAERAYQTATDLGYGREDVNLVMSDATR